MEVLQLSVSKRRINSSSSRSEKLCSRSINNSRRSLGKLCLSSSYNMRISNKQNSSLSSIRRRSEGNLPLSIRCNMYNNLCNRRRRSLGNLHCKKGTRPPRSNDEILNYITRTEQECPKYKPGAPMLPGCMLAS
jgi:hypothetical protein